MKVEKLQKVKIELTMSEARMLEELLAYSQKSSSDEGDYFRGELLDEILKVLQE